MALSGCFSPLFAPSLDFALQSKAHILAAVALACVLLVAMTALLFSAPEEKKISVYSNAANYTLPIVQKNGQDYVGFLEVLEPLGQVSAKLNGARWKIRFNNIDAEFNSGKTRSRILGHDYDLSSPFALENGRGL